MNANNNVHMLAIDAHFSDFESFNRALQQHQEATGFIYVVKGRRTEVVNDVDWCAPWSVKRVFYSWCLAVCRQLSSKPKSWNSQHVPCATFLMTALWTWFAVKALPVASGFISLVLASVVPISVSKMSGFVIIVNDIFVCHILLSSSLLFLVF